MTLDPVFRGRRAVAELTEAGYLDRLKPSIGAHAEALRAVEQLLPELIDKHYLETGGEPESELPFVQRNFFLILFHSILSSLGCSPDHLRFYGRFNVAIKGLVTSGDNLFDDEAKRLLPLRVQAGSRFESIVQLLCFDRISVRVCLDGVRAGWLSEAEAIRIERRLLSELTRIGALEGSEEEGVDEVLPVDEMIDRVHRVRGGALFSLAFIAPSCLEDGAVLDKVRKADVAIAHLGTAFQMVDDLTDFAFDMTHGRQSLVAACGYHSGNPELRAAVEAARRANAPGDIDAALRGPLRPAAVEVLKRAQAEGRLAFEQLRDLGFWFSAERSDALVRAIVGIEGVELMDSLSADA